MSVYDQLLSSDLLNDPYFNGFYEGYFPKSIRARAGVNLPPHRLRRHILGTILTNRIVNQAGVLFFFQMQLATGRSVSEIAMVYYLFDSALNFPELRRLITKTKTTESEKYNALIELESHIIDWVQAILLIPSFTASFEMADQIKQIANDLEAKGTTGKSSLNRWIHRGFSEPIAKKLSGLELFTAMTDLLFLDHMCENVDVPTLDLIDTLDHRFELKWLEHAVRGIEVKSQWELAHKGILLQTIKLKKLALVRLAVSKKGIPIDERIKTIQTDLFSGFKLFFSTVSDLKATRMNTLTGLTVAINRLNFI